MKQVNLSLCKYWSFTKIPKKIKKGEKTACGFSALSIERPSPERRRRGFGRNLEVSEAGRAG